jgi:AcrR family transcriptional regulator
MNDDRGHNRWIDAGLKEMGRGGVERVRVEVLAERLGVTKGGFYRRFKDRRALLDALLATWAHGRIAAVEQQTALGNESAADRLKSVIRLYSERVNPEGMAIEMAIRQWARSDPAAAAAVARVDTARMSNVAQLYVRMGFTSEDAQAHVSRPATAQARRPHDCVRRCSHQYATWRPTGETPALLTSWVRRFRRRAPLM